MPILTPLPSLPLPSHLDRLPSSVPLHPSLPSKSLSLGYSFIFIINQVRSRQPLPHQSSYPSHSPRARCVRCGQIYGPGVLAIPIVFQQSGVVLTVLTMAAFMVISGLSSSLLAQAIALIPGNCHYERRFEFSSAVLYFWGRRWHALSAVLLNVTVQSYNLASIVICAQSVDQALVELFGHTYALTLYPQAGAAALDQAGFDVLTSGAFSLSLTLGYLVVVALFLPTCFQVRSQQPLTLIPSYAASSPRARCVRCRRWTTTSRPCSWRRSCAAWPSWLSSPASSSGRAPSPPRTAEASTRWRSWAARTRSSSPCSSSRGRTACSCLPG